MSVWIGQNKYIVFTNENKELLDANMIMTIDRTEEFRQFCGHKETKPLENVQPLSDFTAKAVELLQHIQSIETLLANIETKYVQPTTFIRTSKSTRMSNRDKDAFDADVMELVKDCGIRIDCLQNQTLLPHTPTLQLEHEKEVITYLLERLRNIATISKRLQKQRYALPFLMTHRLLPEEKRLMLADNEDELIKSLQRSHPNSKPPSKSVEPCAPVVQNLQSPPSSAKQPSKPLQVPSNAPFFASQQEELDFTEDQERRFRMENLVLQRHLQHNVEDAKQMEGKMAEISNLMGQFADKIMEQQTDIEMIHQHAQETNSNVKQSNKILEQTQHIGKGYGFMIFCCYVFFALLLHLVHWIN